MPDKPSLSIRSEFFIEGQLNDLKIGKLEVHYNAEEYTKEFYDKWDSKKVDHLLLKGTGHYDFIDICVLLPVEVSVLFRRENSGPLLWDM